MVLAPVNPIEQVLSTTRRRRVAFISYATREDGQLGRALELMLRRHGRRWWRPRRVFRDENSLGAGLLWQSLDEAVRSSEWLVLIASPEAADPERGVAREVGYWLAAGRHGDHILLACTGGQIAWNADGDDVDWDRTTALPRVFDAIRLAERNVIDFTWARESGNVKADSRFHPGAVKLLATIENKDPDEIDGDQVRLERLWKLTKRLVAGTLSVLLVASIGFGITTWVERNNAREQLRTATSLRLVSEAQLMLSGVRHDGDIRAFQQLLAANAITAINPGALLDAVVSRRSTVKIMRATSGVSSIAVNQATQRVASGGKDGVIQVWDLRSGRSVGPAMTSGPAPVNAVAFSPDGRSVLAGDADGAVRLWDLATAQQIRETSVRHGAAVTSVASNADGRKWASADTDGTVQMWDAGSLQPVRLPVRTAHYQVWSVAFSPDGRRLATGSEDGTVELWDVATGAEIGMPMSSGTVPVWSVAFSPDGHHLAAAGWGDTALWEVATQQPIDIPPTHRAGVWSVGFSPDGRQLASAGIDNTVQVWDTTRWEPVGPPMTGHQGDVKSVTFGPGGQTIISAGVDETVRIWQAPVGEMAANNGAAPSDPVRPMAILDDEGASSTRRIVAGTHSGIQVWDASAQRPGGAAPVLGDEPASSTAISADGRRMASGMRDGSIRLWHNSSEWMLGPLILAAGSEITNLAMSTDGSRVASVAKDGSTRVWDADSGRPVSGKFTLAAAETSSIALSPDGQHIVCGTYGGRVQVWDVNTGRPITPSLVGDYGDDGHVTRVTAVAFSPDGGRFVSASAGDDTVREWNLESVAAATQTMTGHEDDVNAVAFSADGNYIISGANDDTARLWLSATGEPVGQPLQANLRGVTSVAISADERIIAAGGTNGSARVWPGPAAWVENLCAKFTTPLSKNEWKKAIPSGIDYQPTCTQDR
jgi:WD40 repeat protein